VLATAVLLVSGLPGEARAERFVPAAVPLSLLERTSPPPRGRRFLRPRYLNQLLEPPMDPARVGEPAPFLSLEFPLLPDAPPGTLTESYEYPGGIPAAARHLAMQLSQPLLASAQRTLLESWADEPATTAVIVGGALLIGVTTYVGWQADREGQLAAGHSFPLGRIRLGVSGSYSFQTGDWSGGFTVDLSKILELLPSAPRPRPPAQAPAVVKVADDGDA